MTTYSISLDDVDLALLPLRIHKYNDFLKKEHFQFRVMKTEEVEESEPTIYYKCHICALDVPAAFAREHSASVKHRANARIARVATQRTRKLISALPPPLVPQTARFCANCSTIVQKNHEKTKEHRVAVMHDKLLWELMTAYVGDDCDGEDSDLSDTDESVQEKASSRHYNGFATWNEVNNNNEEEKQRKCGPKGFTQIETNEKEIDKKEDNKVENQNNDNKPLDNKKKIIEVTNIDTRKPESSKSSEITNIETETSKSIDTDKEPTQTTAKNEEIATSSPKPQDKIEYVEFVSKNNKIVKVFSDHYHSFTRKGETISCKVCSTVFNSEEVDSHILSLKHLNKMPSTLIDEHCVRKIDEVFSHCILCNAMIKHTNLAKHSQTLGHSQKEKQLVTDNPNFQPTTSNLDKVNTVNAAKGHKLNLDVKIKTVDTVTASKSPEVKVKEVKSIDWPVIYPYEMTKQGVCCVICDCLVPNNPENRKEHLVGLNHVQNVKNKRVFTLEYPFETTKDANIACCAICDIKVSISQASLKEHLDGLNHATNKINKKVIKLEFPYEATKDANFARCAICDIKLTISQVTLKEHLKGQNHVQNEINKKERAANALKPTKQASDAHCVVCDINVPNTLRNLVYHLFESNHVLKELEIQQKAASQTEPQHTMVAQPSTSAGNTFESTSDTIGVRPQNL